MSNTLLISEKARFRIGMQELPSNWTALCLAVFGVGVRHGMDADHLAAIDGLTRMNLRRGQRFAPFCGALFSAGHGAVVLTIAILVGAAGSRWDTPRWLEMSGAWISIGFLALLGFVNLHGALRPSGSDIVVPVGFRGKLLSRVIGARRPMSVAMVGMLFAISFDTVSQAALFALAAIHFGGVEHAALLALFFIAGMLATDGVNGFWVSHLIARADAIAAITSRIMTGAVACVSLLIAIIGAGRLTIAEADEWSKGKELIFGLIVVALVAISYLISTQIAHRLQLASMSRKRMRAGGVR